MDLRSRFTPERRWRAGGASGSTYSHFPNVHPAGGTGAATYWWDFTDIGQLFEDDELTDTVTTAGEAILGLTDKGSSGMNLTSTAEGPLYREDGAAGNAYGEFEDENSSLLSMPTATYDWADETDRGFMVIFDVELADVDQYILHSTASNAWILRNEAGGEAFQSLVDGSSLTGDPDDISTEGAKAWICTHEATSSQMRTRVSFQDNDQLGSVDHAAQANVDIFLGVVDEGNAEFLTGRIYEVVAWLEGGHPTLDEMQEYATQAYNITWVE